MAKVKELKLVQYHVSIEGTSPLIMHNGTAGLDTRSKEALEKQEITKRKASDRTEADEARIRELETIQSFWLDDDGRPTILPNAIRGNLESSARKLKQGSQIREGLTVLDTAFRYDEGKGRTVEQLAKTVQFTTAVVVQRARILRTRAKFDLWGCDFTVEVDPDLVDQIQLRSWLNIGGRRIGLGDWRPQKSGRYGRFTVNSIERI